MGELIDVVNFLEIQNSKTANNNSDKLHDLIGQANFIAASSGRSPMSWYEFKQQVPENQPNYMSNALIGAGAGAAVLAGLSAVFPPLGLGVAASALTGAIFGGLLGGYTQTHNTSRGKQLDAYEHYLNEFEMAGARSLSSPTQEIAATPEANAGKSFADKVLESKHCGCKKSR